ncbi:MAG: folate-binding protein [Paracoccaceae bacterium]
MTDSQPPAEGPPGEEVPGRAVIRVGGADRETFLQGLVSNDVHRLKQGMVYAALLTAQGKYLADFFLVPADDAILIDVAAPLADGLMKRLGLYRLRAAVTIEATALHVRRGTGPAPAGGFADPRDPALGWRAIGPEPGSAPSDRWDALRVAHLIPETLIELIPDETYILEAGFERLHGVDFRKGCYVGQEVTARMKHKTDLRKGLALVSISGAAEPGTPITAEGKEAGTLFTRAGDLALAHLRFDRAEGPMRAGSAEVRRVQ